MLNNLTTLIMKKLTFILTMVIAVTITAIAQSPQAFKYQAVARDATGEILSSHNVSFQISILQGSTTGTAVYVETFNPITNEFGLVNLEIGNGSVVSGVFADIEWGRDSYFLQIKMDESGCFLRILTEFTSMGIASSRNSYLS